MITKKSEKRFLRRRLKEINIRLMQLEYFEKELIHARDRYMDLLMMPRITKK